MKPQTDSYRPSFPIFSHCPELCYLDSASTTQKPETVIAAVDNFYRKQNANIHRGLYDLSVAASDSYEQSRQAIANFINAEHSSEVVFLRGATEGINLVAQSYLRPLLQPDDEILISITEHHSNIVPWQIVASQTQAIVKFVPLLPNGELAEFADYITEKTKLVAITHVSNVLGDTNPLGRIIAAAHKRRVPVLIDGAQAAAHLKIDVKTLDCDFYVFSGHKVYGPTGIGILYAKKELLQSMPPYHGGGGMIDIVSREGTTFREPPERFEAGTPNISGAIGLAAAINFLSTEIGFAEVERHERMVIDYALERLMQIQGIVILGKNQPKTGVISFVFPEIHPHDIGTILNEGKIAVRTGHHCAQLLMESLEIPAATRASFGLYNSVHDADRLIESINFACSIFSKRRANLR